MVGADTPVAHAPPLTETLASAPYEGGAKLQLAHFTHQLGQGRGELAHYPTTIGLEDGGRTSHPLTEPYYPW
jgi:hypothetical protein